MVLEIIRSNENPVVCFNLEKSVERGMIAQAMGFTVF